MFKTIEPPLNLARYIVCFWIGHFDGCLKSEFIHLAHATSKPQLIFHLEGAFEEIVSPGKTERTFDAGVYGHSYLHKQYKTISPRPKIFGVQFYPHAIAKFLSVPVAELCNESIAIDAIFGREGKEVTEKIFSSDCDIKRVEIISVFLEKKFSRPEKAKDIFTERTIHHIENHKGKVCIQQLIDQSCLSQRQFERNFKELTGFSPKSYLKIVRFESLLDYFANTEASLTDTALEFGYYDQAHLNHDFKAFTGLTPLQYLRFYSEQYV